MVRIEG